MILGGVAKIVGFCVVNDDEVVDFLSADAARERREKEI